MGQPQPTYQDRKDRSIERGSCVKRGCRRKAMADSMLCRRCRAGDNAAKVGYAERERERRRAAGLCIWCLKSKIAKSTPGSTACLPCRIRRQRIKISDGGVEGVVEIDRSADIAARTRTHADGRTRYHGQGKRGQQPAAQLNRQDLGMARGALDAGEQGLALLETEEVRSMPRIQRDGVKQAALDQLDRATRHIDDVLERGGHFKVRHGKREGEL